MTPKHPDISPRFPPDFPPKNTVSNVFPTTYSFGGKGERGDIYKQPKRGEIELLRGNGFSYAWATFPHTPPFPLSPLSNGFPRKHTQKQGEIWGKYGGNVCYLDILLYLYLFIITLYY